MELTLPAGDVFNVYLTGPNDATKAVLIIHDWWGMLDYNREWADYFAQLGYRAMVIDLYDGHHPVDVKKAGEYMRRFDQKVNNSKLQTALTALQASNGKVAVLGWSFGGLQAQHAALQNPDKVNALVLFYCRMILDKHNVTTLNCPILAIFSETERTWPDKQVFLEQVMSEANQILQCESYDAAPGFANPDSPPYDSEVAEETQQVTAAFLEKYFA
ncbi:MAG: alpha/beta fold hydrolase [Candidatus Parabeggiatoa sp.]|nr:alpha/beta fold hydrolase [Candidatus Parabeggiatoa sp.]